MKSLLFKLTILTIPLLAACGGGGGGGGDCNISAGQFCDLGKYCAYENNTCGRDGSSGSCRDIPTSCTTEGPQVCTCDSLTFVNQCFAAQAGQDFQAVGECP